MHDTSTLPSIIIDEDYAQEITQVLAHRQRIADEQQLLADLRGGVMPPERLLRALSLHRKIQYALAASRCHTANGVTHSPIISVRDVRRDDCIEAEFVEVDPQPQPLLLSEPPQTPPPPSPNAIRTQRLLELCRVHSIKDR